MKKSIKLIAGIVLIVIILGLSVLAGAQIRERFDKKDEPVSAVTRTHSQVTDFGLQEIGELATEEYFLTIVQTSESAKQLWGHNIIGTKNRMIFSYDVVIKAGVDFEKVKVKVNNANKTITVNIPEAEIFSVAVDHDSFKSYVEENNLINPINMEELNASITELEKTAEETALERNIIEKASENANSLIVGFLRNASNLDGYVVIVK